MNNQVGWFEIYVDDIERAKTFYETVFKTSLETLPVPDQKGMGQIQMLAFQGSMESYGATGALVKMEGVPAGGGGTLVYFMCEDCSVEEDRVSAAGGNVLQSKFSIGEHGFISIVQDSEGNNIGLHSMG